MTTQPTPRTDAEIIGKRMLKELFRSGDELATDVVQINFARELERENQQLQQKVTADRNGDWIDQGGACKVCDGEIPYGHTDKCDIYKLELEKKQLLERAERAEQKACLPIDKPYQDVINERNKALLDNADLCEAHEKFMLEIKDLKQKTEQAEAQIKFLAEELAKGLFRLEQAEAKMAEMRDALVGATTDIPAPAGNLNCHSGICPKEKCSRCSRAEKIYDAISCSTPSQYVHKDRVREIAEELKFLTSPKHLGDCEYSDKVDEGCYLCREADKQNWTRITNALTLARELGVIE